MKEKKATTGPGLFGGGADPLGGALSTADAALLDRLQEVVGECRARDLAEGAFARQHRELHFALRSRFNNYCNALALLLHRELGGGLSRRQLLGWLKEVYQQGAPVTLAGLVAVEPRKAQALVQELGGVDEAFAELEIPPEVAAADRRWEPEELFDEMLELLADSPGYSAQAQVLEDHPLLAEVARLLFGNLQSFHREFGRWLEAQPALYLYWGRNNLSRVLTRNLQVTSRAGKGRALPEVSRVKLCRPVGPGETMYLVSSAGRLYPVPAEDAPIVSFAAGPGAAATRMPGFARGEKPVALLPVGEEPALLALATRNGRLKVMDLAQVKRVVRQGVVVMRLAEDDRLVAAAVVPRDFARLALISRQGRAVAFEAATVKLASRTSMGVYRLRIGKERNAEPAGLVAFTGDEDLVLLGRSGRVLRLRNDEIPSRKGISLGRRLWREPVVGATTCPEGSKLVVSTRKGRILTFWDTQVPRRHALRRGVTGIRLDADDAPDSLATLT